MKKIFLSLLFLLAGFSLKAEIRIFKGWSMSSGDCVATYEDGRLYKGWSKSSGDCIFTFSTEWGLSRAMITWIVCYYFQ